MTNKPTPTKLPFWSTANFFSKFAVAGLVEGVSIGVGFGITFMLIRLVTG